MARFKLKFKPHWLNGVLRISTMMLKHLNMVLEEEGPSSSAAGENVIDVIEPTFHLKPEEKCKFYPSQAKKIAQEILEEELAGKVGDKWIEEWADFADEFEYLSKNIADRIKEQVKSKLNVPRYKLITQVTIGQNKDQGVRISSRCLWDTATDNYATASFQNQHIWASAIVFGLYTD